MKHNKNENFFHENVQGEIYKRAEKIAEKLRAEGWEDAPDNPYNEIIYRKKCAS